MQAGVNVYQIICCTAIVYTIGASLARAPEPCQLIQLHTNPPPPPPLLLLFRPACILVKAVLDGLAKLRSYIQHLVAERP